MTNDSQTPPAAPDAPASVLVIEDEAGLRDMLAYSLPPRGYRVALARDGEEALRLARESDFDLAICDIMMPGMRGTDVLRELKALRPDTEVIMATGYATLETAVESMKEGAYDYIAKPYSLDRLCQALALALERRRLKSRIVTLESLNRLKSEFLANMSHELRTPLNAIMGYTALLRDGTFGPVPGAQAEALGRVETGAADLLTLINGVLDLSKLNAGMMPVYLEDFDAAELAREVAETTRALAVRKGLELRVDAAEALPVRSDRTKVKQILINLVGNALKFTEKGSVTLAVVRDPRTGGAALSVADTGPGIPAESLGTIFEEFRQLDGSASRAHGGTGLGLAIVKKLATLLGGGIAVDSREGSGSVFRLELPAPARAAQAPRPLAAPAAAPSADGRPVVLGIDDDPQVLHLLAMSLEGSGYAFVGAQNAEEGLALARQVKPFAVTLDIMMPHRDGWSVLQTIKKDPELRQLPVIILSIVENKGLGFSLGAADYIVKPFDKKVLIEKLRGLESARGRSLLVVDADAAARAELRRALEGEGYAVAEADSGKAVLEAVARDPRPDAALMDVVVVLTCADLSDRDLEDLERRVAVVLKKGSLSVDEIVAKLKERLASLRRRTREAALA